MNKMLSWREAMLFLVPVAMLFTPLLLRLDQSGFGALNPLLAPRGTARRASCQSNLKQFGLAFAQYVQDHDERFPPVVVGGLTAPGCPDQTWSKADYSSTPVGWADALQPHLKSLGWGCPCEPIASLGDPKQNGYIDYWYNANLSRVRKSTLVAPPATLLLGEGSDGADVTDATYSKTKLPDNWLADRNKPAFRHLGGANYLFADGSVAWLRPHEIASPRVRW